MTESQSTKDFSFHGTKALQGRDCCGKPNGCTNESATCAYRQHPYKRWARGEITLDEMIKKLSS